MTNILKHIEHKIKPIISRMFKQKRALLSFKSNITTEFGIKKILVLRHDRIGDLIISQPIFRYLKNKFPNIEIDLLLSNYNKSASNCVISYINKIFIYDKSFLKSLLLIKKLRTNKYDLVIDLFDKKSSTSALLLKYINPKFTAGFDKENSEIYNFLVKRLDEKKYHIIERTAQILTLFGIEPDKIDLRPEYKLNKSYDPFPIADLINQNKKYIAINLSGSNKSKYWGIENNIEFINLFTSHFPDFTAVLIYTQDYSEIAKLITNSTSAIQCELLKSFDQYVYALIKADIILTPDSSAVHIASAFNIKSIILYNQDIETKDIILPWFPYKSKYLAFGTKSSELKDISPTLVFEKVLDFI